MRSVDFYQNTFFTKSKMQAQTALAANFNARDFENKPSGMIFDYFNAVKNYNIPFLGVQSKTSDIKPSPFYVIDAYKNFKKFDDANQAASAFNVSVSSVLRCANGDCESVGDFVFAFADCIEEKGRNGENVPDKIIINLASEVLCSLAAFKTIPLTIDEALELKSKSKQKSQSKVETSLNGAKRIKASIYAIDKNGRYMKFEKVQDLLDKLDISKASVYKCLRKEKDNINGIVFCYDFDIETMDEKGKIVANNRLIKKQIQSLKNSDSYVTLDLLLLRKNGSNSSDINKSSQKPIKGILANIPDEDLSAVELRYLQKPFYAVDENKNYRKFYLQKNVADALGIYKEKISDCLQKRIKSIKGFSFVYANEVEKVDKFGNIFVDEDKLFGKRKEDDGFYFVDKNGKYNKFKTPKEANQILGISYGNILNCILSRQDKASCYVFAKAADLEIEKEDGIVSINKEKLQELRAFLNKSALYLVETNGNYKRYETRAQAAKAIGVLSQDISAAITGRKKTIQGYVAVDANEIEKISDDGKITVDMEKIDEALALSKEIRTIDVSKNGFYAINKNGKYKKFYSISDAKNDLNIQYTRIKNCLLGLEKMANGYVFALAEDIETKNEDGNIEIDMAKIAQKVAFFESRAIYTISKDGKCTRYSNQKAASDALGIPLKNISRCINKTIKETYGYSFLYANEVEIENDDNKPALDEDLINEKVRYLNRNVVYAIDKEGNYQRFEDRLQAQEALGINKASIADCLNGKYKTSHGYVFAFPWEVEIRLEDGSFVVDEDKIQEKLAA